MIIIDRIMPPGSKDVPETREYAPLHGKSNIENVIKSRIMRWGE